MKVLMINSVCGIRSTGRICTGLAVEMERQGHEVKIAYGRETVPEQFQRFAVRIGSDLDVKLHGLKSRTFDAMGFGSKRATKRFIEWVKAYNPDVIHLHNVHGYYINIEILFNYLKTCGKRIIWTLHDCWAFTGHSAYCDAVDCTRWKTCCHDCPQKKIYPKSLVEQSYKNWQKKKEIFKGIPNLTIVTPSNWLKGLVEESFLREYKVEVIHNGIDTNVFKPIESEFRTKYYLEDKTILLGVATSWNFMKGLSDFCALSKILEANYQIVLVGLTERQLRRIPNSILGIKRTANLQELVQIYSASDIFLNLTYCDNYPTVNLEAAACGTPVITYNTGGSPESAKFFGVSVDKGDTCSMISYIKNYRMIKKNPMDKIDYKYMLQEYIDIYKQ